MAIPLVFRQKLWIVAATVEPGLADSLGDQLGTTAVAVSVMAPPRRANAQVEAIYDHEPDMPRLNAQAAIIAAINGKTAPVLTCRPAPPLDWLKKVAEDFPPFRIADWTIHGALHRRKVADRRMALQIDATSAFGTGEHPTTRGCLVMLNRLLKTQFKPKSMLDIGCGSGILAMGFVTATHGKAIATDLDPMSVTIARHNRATNGLKCQIKIGLGRGYHSALVRKHAPYDMVMANIFARPLSLMAKDLKQHLRPGGVAILAGLLNSQASMVLNAHRAQGLKLLARQRSGEWTILALKRCVRA